MNPSRALPGAILARWGRWTTTSTLLLVLAAGALADPTRAAVEPARLASEDAGGLTLTFSVEGWTLGEPGPDGRATLAAPGLDMFEQPGRPILPIARALVAVPPGARVAARIVGGSAEETREGVRLAIGPRPYYRDDDAFGPTADYEAVPPIRDGTFPADGVQLGEPFTVRRQRVVWVYAYPFRYDDASGRLFVRSTLQVRVDFSGGGVLEAVAAPEDRHWEPVLAGSIVNYEQGRRMRERAAATGAPRGSLFDPIGRRPGAAAIAGSIGFDEGSPEVRVRLDTTGVYSIYYDDLAAAGYPASVPVGEVSLHRHEYLGGTSPPYGTIEIPIEVDDLAGGPTGADPPDGFFGPGDRIVAYVQAWASRAGIASRSQRAWGDAEVVYATRIAGGAGLRVATRPGWRNQVGLTPLASYPYTQRMERNFSYNKFPNDTNLTDQFSWTVIDQYYVRPETLLFAAHHLDTTRQVQFTIVLQGLRNNPHYNWAQVKNAAGQYTTILDSTNAAWSGKGLLTRTLALTGSALSEGNTNRLRSWGRTNNPLPSPANPVEAVNAGLERFEYTYWRAYRGLRGTLVCNSADVAGEVQIRARGFGFPTVRAWDVTDPLNPVRLTLDPSHVTPDGFEFALEFQDSVATGQPHAYVVFDNAKAVTPDRISAVTRRDLTNRASGDYVMIVPEAFMAAAQPLADFRAAQGLDVAVAPLEAVFDEFNGGRRSSYAIKRYLEYAYAQWNAAFVLLVGDGSEDPQNYLAAAGPDVVPVHKIRGPVGVSEGLEIVPSDNWYVWCLGCPDPSSSDRVPDMFLGRLPVNDVAELNATVSKLIAYEGFAADQTWRRNVTLLADDMYSAATTFGQGTTESGYCRRSYEDVFLKLCQTVGRVISDDAGLRQSNPEIVNMTYLLRGEQCNPCAPDSCRPSQTETQSRARLSVTPALFNSLNAGTFWWSFQGHANLGVLTHESIYENAPNSDDRVRFTNDDRLFLFTAHSCHANQFGREREREPGNVPSLGERMVILPNRGAIASWASVGYEVIPRSNGVTHINVELARSLFSKPVFDPYLGERGARVVLGEAIATALTRYVPDSVTAFPFERDIAMTYALLGDPATRLSIGPPQAVVEANDLPVQSGTPVRLHTAGDSLRLEATLVSNVEITSIALDRADSTGTVTLPPGDYMLTPSFPDTFPGSSGGRRYALDYRTTLAPRSTRYTFRTTDRYGLPSTFDVVFAFQTVLRAEGNPISDGDAVSPTANLSILLLSPAPVDPATEITLTVNGTGQPFTATPNVGDPSGREWVLAWTHAAYPIDEYDVAVAVAGGETQTRRFSVQIGGSDLRLDNAMAFPNPFEEDRGTSFSFTLVSGAPADMLIRVYTVSGKLVQELRPGTLLPGYHQLPWDGRDAEGVHLANGIYFYRMLANNGSSTTLHEGRLVKLRRPRRGADPAAAP
jgi:hypothetical protein